MTTDQASRCASNKSTAAPDPGSAFGMGWVLRGMSETLELHRAALCDLNHRVGNLMHKDELEPKLDAILARQDEAISELEPLKATVDELRAELAASQTLTPSAVEKLDRLAAGTDRLANIIQPAEPAPEPEQPVDPVDPGAVEDAGANG